MTHSIGVCFPSFRLNRSLLMQSRINEVPKRFLVFHLLSYSCTYTIMCPDITHISHQCITLLA